MVRARRLGSRPEGRGRAAINRARFSNRPPDNVTVQSTRVWLSMMKILKNTFAFLPPGTTADPSSAAVANVAFPSDPYIC